MQYDLYIYSENYNSYGSPTIFMQPQAEHSIGVIKEADMDK
jgi:hypothetical protein